MERYDNCGSAVAVRASTASEVQYQFEVLADRLAEVGRRVSTKLEPVMMPEREEPCKGDSPLEAIIPPYFDALRRLCRRMNDSIDCIESALNRTGL